MKFLLLIIVLLISSGSYYGEVNEQGEKVISIQENVVKESFVIDEKVEQIYEAKEEIVETQKNENNEETKEIKVEKEKKVEKQNNGSTKVTEEVTEKQVAHIVEQPKELMKEEPIPQINPVVCVEEQSNPLPQCNGNNHAVGVGNSNQWFDTEEQAIALYNSEIKLWGDRWTNYEIDDETYYKNCPDGYEDWTCPICGKWTINLYY